MTTPEPLSVFGAKRLQTALTRSLLAKSLDPDTRMTVGRCIERLRAGGGKGRAA